MTFRSEYSGLEIAIVGLDCRFPGAKDPQSFREAIASGADLITHFDAKTLLGNGVPQALLDDATYVRAQGVLQDYDKFDPKMFGMNRAEAELIDPQLRMLLQCGYRALEDAGIVPASGQPCGVFVGAYYNTYRDIALRTGRMDRPNDAFMVNLLNEKDFLATQLAYRLDLSGPAVTVQTACSTSLVAVHQACQSLLAGECHVALAGGATCRPVQTTGYQFQDGGIYSPDGVTRTFDAKAEGTVPSNGAGIVVLKRLEDALADGNHIRAVIRGSAIGNDGNERVGFTAPSSSGQARIIANALSAASLDPASISYVEAHGSGTAIGDPIEIKALTSAYGMVDRPEGRRIGIGSVKTNIGHTHAAAGVAGLIKTIFALEDKWLPPSLNFETPNPMASFDSTPFRVIQAGEDWPQGRTPRRAAVSSFGMGGTGAHVLLEEAPEQPKPPQKSPRSTLLTISAASAAALERSTCAIADALGRADADGLADVGYTLHTGRKAKEHRMAVVAADAARAQAALRGLSPDDVVLGASAGPLDDIDFLFPGLGDQRPGMIAGLYREEPVFRSALDRCFEVLQAMIGLSLPDVLVRPGAPKSEGIDLRRMMGRARASAAQSEEVVLADTAVAQPTVFAIEYALAQLWKSWGISPKHMIGYSLGEYVAACLAGVFTLEDALEVVARRSQAIAELPGGTMLAVGLGADAVQAMLSDGLGIAAVNGPDLCVVAGSAPLLETLSKSLAASAIQCRPVQSTHAFHTSLLKPAIPALIACLSPMTLSAPKIPFVSNVTGNWIKAEEATDPAYWARHMCEPVQFHGMVKTLLAAGTRAVVEVGPGHSTASLFVQVANREGQSPLVVSSLTSAFDDRCDHAQMLRAAGRLWVEGANLNARTIQGADSRLVPLPAYQFDLERFWIDEQPNAAPKPAARGDRSDNADWYSSLGWRRIDAAPADAKVCSGRWLIVGGTAVAEAVADQVRANFPSAAVATMDWPHGAIQSPAALSQQISQFEATGLLYLGCLDAPPDVSFDDAQAYGFDVLLDVIRAISDRGSSTPLELVVATPGAWSIHGEAGTDPAFATCLGIIRTVPHEVPTISARLVDLPPKNPVAQTARFLAAEIQMHGRPDLVVVRANRHWTPDVQDLRLTARDLADDCRNGVFLITGGTGALGLIVAERLAQRGARAVILVSRSAVEDHILEPVGSALRAGLARIKAYGTQVVFERADVADAVTLSGIVMGNMVRFGRIDGAFHAAGVEGAGLMQLKSAADAHRVMRPKCLGALALLRALQPVAPRFVMLFSSSIAITGALGQSDYGAANIFLDALALARDGQNGTQLVSVNWDAWREAGMAHRNLALTATDWQDVDHPFLKRVLRTGTRTIYEADVSDSDWLVDEHRMDAHAVIAGTGQIEFIRAATTHLLTGQCGTGGDKIVIDDLVFLSPAVLAAGGTLKLRVVLVPDERGRFLAQCATRPADSPSASWRLHVRATTGALADAPKAAPANIPALIASAKMSDCGAPQHDGPMSFGPRSRCLRRVFDGGQEALAEIMLPENFAGETTGLPLHPSVMDISAAFVGLHLAKRFRIPLSYGQLRFYGPLRGKIYSHHMLHRIDDGEDIVTADVTIYDENGAVLVEVFDFALQRIDDVDGHMIALLSGKSREILNVEMPDNKTAASPLADQLSHGILPDEGADAIERILSSRTGPNIAVTTRTIDDIKHSLMVKELIPATQASEKAKVRRTSASPYVAPRNSTERAIAGLWGDLLHLEEIGIHDNFFELGGHSLLGLSMASRLRERFKTDLPVSAIFRNLTIARLAETLEASELTA